MTYNYFQLFRCGESADAQGCFVVSEYVFKIQFGCDQFYRVQEVTQQGYNHSVLLICKGYVGFQTCRVACDGKSWRLKLIQMQKYDTHLTHDTIIAVQNVIAIIILFYDK